MKATEKLTKRAEPLPDGTQVRRVAEPLLFRYGTGLTHKVPSPDLYQNVGGRCPHCGAEVIIRGNTQAVRFWYVAHIRSRHNSELRIDGARDDSQFRRYYGTSP